jgi:hypothetical protein
MFFKKIVLFSKFIFLIIVTFFFSENLFCQSIYDFYISQSAIRNQREEKVLVEIGVRLNINEQYRYKKFDFLLQHLVDVAYIYQKINENNETVIPSQVELKGDFMGKYKLGFLVDPFIASAYDTQLIPSFTSIGNNLKMTGKFRDPVTTNQSFGIAYMAKERQDYLIARVGLSARQIRADKFTQLTDNYSTRNIIENYKEDYGVQFKLDVNLNFDSTSIFRSNLELYSTIAKKTEYTFKLSNEFRTNLISNVFAIIMRLDFAYDERQTKKLQYNQVFRIGLNYKFNIFKP